MNEFWNMAPRLLYFGDLPNPSIENQATNNDGTPKTNIVKERVWGLVGYHLQILKQLECVSRSMIFYEEVAQVKDTKLTLAPKNERKVC